MLVCSISTRAKRTAIAASLDEIAAALDQPGTGNVVFATLVDDPASVNDIVDAYTGEVMLEAASATDSFDSGMAYATTLVEAASAADAPDVSTGGDPYWADVKLMLGFEGADASTGAPGMTDESGAAHGTGTSRDQAQIDTAQFKFGTSSLLLDGTTDRVTFPDHNDWNLSNQPFTIECWIRPTTISGTHFICVHWETAGNLAWAFHQNGAQIALNVSTTSTDNITVASGGTLTANAWHAVCVDFDGIKYRIYINGAMVASSTTLRTIYSSSANLLSIGGSSTSGAFGFAGWIDELRLTKAARYASDSGYTVATSAFPRS